MSSSNNITNILNACMEAIKIVLPMEVSLSSPTLITPPFIQHHLSVLIGIIGDERGRILIEGSEDTFASIGEKMFGMQIQGEMLESFTGELGNMICGNLTNYASNKGIYLDITPPTVILGATKIHGFSKGIKLPIDLGSYGSMNILLMMEQN